jgi:two-component system, OmpR family, sensor histidine kinase VicK
VTKKNLLTVFEALGELSTDGIFVYTIRSQSLDYVNKPLLEIFDISHKSFANQPTFFLHHIIKEDLDYLRAEYEKLKIEEKLENVEFRLKSHDEQIRNICCSCFLFGKKKYIAGFFRDITPSREHENYIINYGAKKNTLLDMVTHNLSGPLSLSKNMISSLENAVTGNDLKNVKAHIQLIKENTRHCIDIVSDFLEEEHLVSEQIATKKNRFDVVTKINTILERYRKSYPDFKFNIVKNVEAVYINNDDVKFLQVMNNLISNGVKWSPTGSAIDIIVEDRDDYVSIAVKDPGIGIPDQFKGQIFQKHSPASRVGLRGEKSIGMGLYIVKKLVSLMGGTLHFESQEKKGTTFTITLPKEEL